LNIADLNTFLTLSEKRIRTGDSEQAVSRVPLDLKIGLEFAK
jgi:hypothetical protein